MTLKYNEKNLPTENDIEEMMSVTKLTRTRIKGWFNHRRSEQKETTKTSRYPDEIRLYLKEKYSKNRYPEQGEIEVIMHKTGLNKKQIKNWYSDQRKLAVKNKK